MRTRSPKKISCYADKIAFNTIVRADVLAGDVRDEFLESVTLSIEDQTDFLFLNAGSEFFGRQKHPEFERHVEPWELAGLVDFSSGDIMYSQPATGNEPKNFRHANLTRVVNF